MIATKEQREVWEYFRPVSEAAEIFTFHGWDPFELQELEDKWASETLPHLRSLDLTAKVRAKLELSIKFCQDRIKKIEKEFEQSTKTFAQRRYLIEQKIPVAQKYLQLYLSWRDQTPFMKNWQPMDVVDIKQRGIDAFINSNLERFYG